jgi:hypothetical protein
LDRLELEFFAVPSLAGRSEAINASKFTDAPNAFVIKHGEEGTPVAEICRKAGLACIA